jgi:hypothetical protein
VIGMAQDYRVNLEGLLYSHYIKYDKLTELLNSIPDNIESDKVDIYIDVYDMLKAMYTRNIYAEKQYLIVSAVINIAAHMRGYFWTRFGMLTRIYLVYGEDLTMNHKQFYPTFGDEKFKETLDYDKNNAVVTTQLEMVRLLCAYINGVYFIKRSTNFAMFTYDNIMKNREIPSIIISKSKYAYQLPALFNNVYLLRPQKGNGEDVSYLIYHNIAITKFFSKSINQKTIENLVKINPELLSVLIALTGFPSYNMKTVCNITVASRMLADAVTSGRIINRYNTDIDYVYNALEGLDKYIDPVTFKYRFNAVDLVFQHRIYNSSAEARDITWIVDLENKFEVQRINNQYFIDNPLDLNNL